MTEWQQFCLSTLQLDQWILRRDDALKLGIYLGPDTVFPLSSKANILLNSMLGYLGLTTAHVQIIQNMEHVQRYSKVWLLADDEVSLPIGFTEDQIWIRTKGLQHLLEQPICKKEVFRTLRQCADAVQAFKQNVNHDYDRA